MRFSPKADASIGTVSPWMRLASSPANVNVSTERATSFAECFHALPASRAMVSAKRSRRASMSAAAFSRIAARRCAGVADHDGNAACARRTAASTSSAPAAGSRPISSPVNLSMTCSQSAIV